MEDPKKDLDLLEKVMMRLAVVKDDQLEKQVQSLLVPVLGKLISSNEETRKKVTHLFFLDICKRDRSSFAQLCRLLRFWDT